MPHSRSIFFALCASVACSSGPDDEGGTSTPSGSGAMSGDSLGDEGSGAAGTEPSSGGSTGSTTSAAGSAESGGTGSNVGTGGEGAAPGDPCARHACGSHKWACWPIPTSASETNAAHPQNYTDLGDGTVRDNVTCLTWEKTNPDAVGTWQHNHARCAQLAADEFGGASDWRLPTRIEMASITDVNLGRTGYPEVFDVTGGYYVTGSFWYKTILTDSDATAGNETDMVWGYGTNGFASNAISREDTNLVARCVRGNGQGEAADEYAVEPPEHYTIENLVVADNYTGLRWQRGYSPGLMTWEEAPSYCASLSLDSETGFRVPTLTELASTVDEAQVGGAIIEEAFPDNPVGCRAPEFWFWASEASQVGGVGWGLSYCDGFTGWNSGAEGEWNHFPTARVRCVK